MYEIKSQEDQPELVIAELLGVINKMAESNKRLEGVARTYERMMLGYDGKAAALRDERDRARSIAATLEAECAACWGPVHAETLNGIRHGS